MTKVLVVGGAGYIGSHVVKALLAEDFEVRVFDNLSTGHKINLFDEAEFVQGDILSPAEINKAMQGCEAVIHLAAKKAVGESMEKPEYYASNNLVGSINILNAMIITGAKYIVFSSSSTVYGEPQYVPMDENHPLSPMNFYGFTKLEVEKYMGWYDVLKGIRYTSLRYFNAAGYDKEIKGRDEKPQNLLPIIEEVVSGKREFLQVFGDDYETRDGTCVRDYIHVNDLASAHVLSLQRLMRGEPSSIYNLGTQNGVTVKEVVAAAEEVFGQKIPLKVVARRAGDPAVLVASSTKAQKELGWKAKILDIKDILR